MNLYQSVKNIDIPQSEEEKYLYVQFKSAKTLEDAIKNSSMDRLKMFNVFLKMIEQESIRIYYKNKAVHSIIIEESEKSTQQNDSNIRFIKASEAQLIEKMNAEQEEIQNEELLTNADTLTDIQSLDNDYEFLYSRAMALYIRRNYKESLYYFERCLEINANDTRVNHNINKLKERLT